MVEYTIFDLVNGGCWTVELEDSSAKSDELLAKVMDEKGGSEFTLFKAVGPDGSWLEMADPDYTKLFRGNDSAVREKYLSAVNEVSASDALPHLSEAASPRAVHFILDGASEVIAESMWVTGAKKFGDFAAENEELPRVKAAALWCQRIHTVCYERRAAYGHWLSVGLVATALLLWVLAIPLAMSASTRSLAGTLAWPIAPIALILGLWLWYGKGSCHYAREASFPPVMLSVPFFGAALVVAPAVATTTVPAVTPAVAPAT